jgi:hypothetical protein
VCAGQPDPPDGRGRVIRERRVLTGHGPGTGRGPYRIRYSIESGVRAGGTGTETDPDADGRGSGYNQTGPRTPDPFNIYRRNTII